MSVYREFKEFVSKGNALDLAIGVIIGAALTSVVNSIVNDLINPIINLFIGHIDFKNFVIGLPGKEELRIGSFINSLINFFIVALAVFIIIKQINRFRAKAEAHNKHCPFCFSEIPIKAIRCPHCTSQLE